MNQNRAGNTGGGFSLDIIIAALIISAALHASQEGRIVRVLIDGPGRSGDYTLSSRTDGGRLVHLKGDPALIGQFADVTVTASNTWALYGELRACAAGGGESKPGISAAAPLAGRGDEARPGNGICGKV